MKNFLLLAAIVALAGCNLNAAGQKMIDQNMNKYAVPALQALTDSVKQSANGEQKSQYVSAKFETIGGDTIGPASPQMPALTPVAAGPVDSPEDVLTVLVCQVNRQGQKVNCSGPQNVKRRDWPQFWRENGGPGVWPNGQPMVSFTTVAVKRADSQQPSQQASSDDPSDVFLLNVDGVPQRVLRCELTSFYLSHKNSQVQFMDLIRARSVLKDEGTIRVIPTVNKTYPTSLDLWTPANAAACNCGCNGQCGGTCGCANCSCARQASSGCASCGTASGGERQGFMQRGPVRRFFANRWFPGKRAFRFFGNGGFFRRGGGCSGC